jgi:beta-glucosidase
LEYTHEAPVFLAGLTLNWMPPLEPLRKHAVSVAQSADVVVAFVGISPRLEGEEMDIHLEGFNRGDRADLNLPRAQQDLLEELVATGKPLILVLLNGTPMSVNWAHEHASAILEAWYPGVESGTAIAETLAGLNNPAGRLPDTFFKSVDQLPPFADYSMAGRTYRYFTGDPLYPFGFGLSYTKFEYDRLIVANKTPATGDEVEVGVDVKNAGAMAGDEVVEVYLTHREAVVPAPIRALVGFRRIHLEPDEVRHVSFKLTPRDLSLVDVAGRRIVNPGEITVSIGGKQPGFSGSADAATTGILSGNFKLQGTAIPLN